MRPFSFQAPMVENEEGVLLAEPNRPGMAVRMQLPRPVPPYSLLRVARDLSEKS